MDEYGDLVSQTRNRVRELRPLRSDLAGDEVQLSVRLPAGLRAAVAEAATRRHMSVTAFVVELFERAVREESDPFAGLAADLAEHLRSALAGAIESGAYADAADEIDASEQRSDTG